MRREPTTSVGRCQVLYRGRANGEDGVIAEILAVICTTSRTFLEFGVQDGREGSCVALAEVRGWSGWFSRRTPRTIGGPRSTPGRSRHHCPRDGDGENINELFAELGIAASIDVASIDVASIDVASIDVASIDVASIDVASIDIDGADHEVWQALETTRPRLIVIEYSSALDPDVALVPREPRHPWDGTQNVGSSLGTILAIADAKGYDLVHREAAGVNAFFVAREAGWDGPVNDDVPRRTPNYFSVRAGASGHRPDAGRLYRVPGHLGALTRAPAISTEVRHVPAGTPFEVRHVLWWFRASSRDALCGSGTSLRGRLLVVPHVSAGTPFEVRHVPAGTLFEVGHVPAGTPINHRER